MNNFAAAGFGCVAAIALWKATKERMWPTLTGMFVIAMTLKYADRNEDFGWLIFIAGCAVFCAGFYGLKKYDERVAKLSEGHILKPKLLEPLQSEKEEIEFDLDATTDHDYAQHGWDRWKIFPDQKRLVHNHCAGGPPDCTEVYEYAVRHTSVFARLGHYS